MSRRALVGFGNAAVRSECPICQESERDRGGEVESNEAGLTQSIRRRRALRHLAEDTAEICG